MTVATLIMLAVTAIACGIVVAPILAELRAKPDILTERERSKVIVTLDDGAGFRGVLWTQDRTGIVLRNADALGVGERGTDIGVDGEVFLLRESVSYVQVL